MYLRFTETWKVTKKASLAFLGVLLLTTLAISSINTSALEVKAQTVDDINYDVAIDAYCLTENASVSVEVRIDGGVWQLTPYTFTNLNDSHIIEVSSLDANGHPFAYWNDDNNLTSTNRTISSGGNYTAIYQDTVPEVPDINYDIAIDAHCLTENASVSVEVRMDGGAWQLTPYTFTNLNDSHVIEVNSSDPNGHPFAYWDDDNTLTSPNRTISSGGNYTAIYQDTVPEVPELEFEIDIDPDTLNLKSRGKFVTVYIELPEGYNTTDLELVNAELEGIPAINDTKYGFVTDPELVDHDGDGLMEFMVKFERAAVQKTVREMIGDEKGKFEEIELTVSGEFSDGTTFEDSDSIKVINPPTKSSPKSNDSTPKSKQKPKDKRNK